MFYVFSSRMRSGPFATLEEAERLAFDIMEERRGESCEVMRVIAVVTADSFGTRSMSKSL